MANDYLSPPGTRVPPEPDEPWRVDPSRGPGRRFLRGRRLLLVPAASVLLAATAGAAVVHLDSTPGAPARTPPAQVPDAWLGRDRPPPAPAFPHPAAPAAPDDKDTPGRDPRRTEPGTEPGRSGPGTRPGNAPAHAETSTAPRPDRSGPQGRVGDDAVPARPRGRPSHGPSQARRPPAWIKAECRRRYPRDAARRAMCVKAVRHRLGR